MKGFCRKYRVEFILECSAIRTALAQFRSSVQSQMIYSLISIQVPSIEHMYCTGFDKNPV